MYKESTISKYLSELASREPTPGGGSAAALMGATGVALLEKVVNFTLGKEKYKSVEEEMKSILDSVKGIRDSMIDLCSEDAKAYGKFSEAFKLPKGDERKEKVQSALKEAAEVPFKICKRAHEAIKLCVPVAHKGNMNLITDTSLAGIFLESTFKSAFLNVEINLKSIRDDLFVKDKRKILKKLEEELKKANDEVQDIVKKKMGE